MVAGGEANLTRVDGSIYGMQYDAIIVGGGPAGLSAALVLGRCRRRVLVCDAGHPRNEPSEGVHGYFTRDCMHPAELLRIGREQLHPYGVEFRAGVVTEVEPEPGGFRICLEDGTELHSRKVLLATGVRDRLPEIDGLREMFGKSVHHCPYCDGWEWRDQPIAVYARRQTGFGMSLALRTTWTEDVALLTDGPSRLSREQRGELRRFNITIREQRVVRLEGDDGMLRRIVFEKGEPLERRALFLNTGFEQQSPIAKTLGCVFTPKGVLQANRKEQTNVQGIYVAGDASRDVQMVIVAAAEGVKAAKAINEDLQRETRERMIPRSAG